jgi:hypothetical protein
MALSDGAVIALTVGGAVVIGGIVYMVNNPSGSSDVSFWDDPISAVENWVMTPLQNIESNALDALLIIGGILIVLVLILGYAPNAKLLPHLA